MRLYDFLVDLFSLLARLFGVKISGREQVPQTGPLVVIGNHRCWTDILLMALAVYPRHVHFMAKSEYGQNKPLDWLIRHCECFKVERGEVDVKAIKTALGYLKKQEVLGIFPEGTRNRTEAPLLPFKEGAFMIAARGKAQVLPLTISHAERFFKLGRPKAEVRIGAAFSLDAFQNEQGKFEPAQAAAYAGEQIKKMLPNGQDF